MSSGRLIAQWLTRIEIPFLALAYAYFVVSDQLPLAVFGLLALIWLARWLSTGHLSRATPLDLPIVLLLACLPLSYSVSIYTWQSLPKVYGVLLSVAFYYALVNAIATRDNPHVIASAKRGATLAPHASVGVSTAVLGIASGENRSRNDNARDDWQRTIFWIAVVCAGVALAGLIGTDWAQSKIVSASFIYDRLPRIIQGIPRSIAGGFARNGVGGVLTLTIPLLAALAALSLRAYFANQSPMLSNRNHDIEIASSQTPLLAMTFKVRILNTAWIITLFSLALSIVTLALTQSRGGILGTAVGLLAIGIWRERRLAWLVLVGIIGLVLVFSLGYGNTLIDFALQMDRRVGTLASRMEVWQRGLMMVQDFPFTGIGIGTYNSVAHLLYPFFIASPDEIVAHAHNQFLQVAVDVGIPGLIAYIALLTGFSIAAVRAYRSQIDERVRAIIVGAGCGLLAHHVFGLTDAFILGTKPGVLMWVWFALVAAAYQLNPAKVAEPLQG